MAANDSLLPLLEHVAELLRGAEHITCLTGAGVSAESGVPTFRGVGGLWEGRRPETLATPEAFASDPEEVWRFYLWRRRLLLACKPNPGHYALARLERKKPGFTLITQNVDGLHVQAGSRRVLAVHGDIWIDRCTRCGQEARSTGEDFERIPHCGLCGALARPGVVWFGELLPTDVWTQAERAAASCDLMLVAGTSSLVYPAASLADVARAGGATVVEVNPEATPLTSEADVAVPAPSGQSLPTIVDRLGDSGNRAPCRPADRVDGGQPRQ